MIASILGSSLIDKEMAQRILKSGKKCRVGGPRVGEEMAEGRLESDEEMWGGRLESREKWQKGGWRVGKNVMKKVGE